MDGHALSGRDGDGLGLISDQTIPQQDRISLLHCQAIESESIGRSSFPSGRIEDVHIRQSLSAERIGDISADHLLTFQKRSATQQQENDQDIFHKFKKLMFESKKF